MPNNAVTLLGALKERLLVVPNYQRPYAWEQRQLDDLWQDLDLMADNAKHYTGTLVLKDHPGTEHVTDAGDTLGQCEVVDGQQRLTTCLLLIDRLHRKLASIPTDEAELRSQNLIRTYGPILINGQHRARLQLGTELNEHWLKNILLDRQQPLKPMRTDGERRLDEAAAYFDGRLHELCDGQDDDESVRRLQRLQTRVTSGLRFLVYEVDAESDAGEIFETLNDRGRGLTELEKIKNYLLFLAHSLPKERRGAFTSDINMAWKRVYEYIAGQHANEDLLLRAHWLATADPVSRNWAGAASVKKKFSRERFVPGWNRLSGAVPASSDEAEQVHAELVSLVAEYLDTLQSCALFTNEFINPAASFDSFGPSAELAKASSARLRRTGITAVFRPLIFALRLTQPTNGDAYNRLVNACERYAARVFIIGQRRSNTGQARLYRLAYELYTGTLTIEEVLAELDDLTWTHGNDDVVRSGLNPKANWYGRAGHKYLLYEYELSKAARPDDVKDFATYSAGARSPRTTEHILPKHPRWDRHEWTAFTREQHAELLHGLGNLVLTDDNSAYQNYDFLTKKGQTGQASPCYSVSALASEREIALFDDWTPESIEKRRQSLLEWALIRWPVTPRTLAVTDDDQVDATEPESDELEDASPAAANLTHEETAASS
ncbi:DUF262 domain-containing protein [Ornithinibacter aureus]|uniref:DUF262 domain-containing protein n=1 Tax=Ornithinibacter aureus TaxID=622664 RepID=A0ABP8JMU5_9MICO|nr:DUF262 domain-containing protein [Ornithinibacter aureus]KAF0834752.1 uncharacterized protein DUF1524 [Ornithinibacter aureus]